MKEYNCKRMQLILPLCILQRFFTTQKPLNIYPKFFVFFLGKKTLGYAFWETCFCFVKSWLGMSLV